MVIISLIFTALELNIFKRKIKSNKFRENKNMITYNYRIQVYDSIMCLYLNIGFIDFMLKGSTLLDYKNYFSPNDYEKNDQIILKYFQKLKRLKGKNYIASFVISVQSFKNFKNHTS